MNSGPVGIRFAGTVLLFTVVVAVCAAFGCATRSVILDGHRRFPKVAQFSIMPQNYQPQELVRAGIRTDGAYVSIGFRPQAVQDLKQRDNPHSDVPAGVYYYRFWPNGRMIARLSWTDPLTQRDADSFERGWMGYFQVASDGSIDVEFYSWQGGRGTYGYTRIAFAVEGDTLWVDYGHNAKYDGVPIQSGYRFLPVERMRTQPDW